MRRDHVGRVIGYGSICFGIGNRKGNDNGKYWNLRQRILHGEFGKRQQRYTLQ
jgi:hypothetical protein